MSNYATAEITALSSKGQIVLPNILRKTMNLQEGCKFIVFSDGENILLKPIQMPDIAEFENLVQKTRNWAKNVGMEESDIGDAIKAVRSEA